MLILLYCLLFDVFRDVFRMPCSCECPWVCPCGCEMLTKPLWYDYVMNVIVNWHYSVVRNIFLCFLYIFHVVICLSLCLNAKLLMNNLFSIVNSSKTDPFSLLLPLVWDGKLVDSFKRDLIPTLELKSP